MLQEHESEEDTGVRCMGSMSSGERFFRDFMCRSGRNEAGIIKDEIVGVGVDFWHCQLKHL